MNKNILSLAILLALLSLQCSRIDTSEEKLTLKESIDKSAERINKAFSKIAVTRGYQLLSVTEEAAKSSDIQFKDSIRLDMIAGIYDYRPDSVSRNHFYFPVRLFKRTGTSKNLIVNLPEKLVFHPKHLHNHVPVNKVLKNNFKITATDYHFYYKWWNKFDYKLIAGFAIDNEDIGELSFTAVINPDSGSSSFAEYTFTEGYSIIKTWQTGETTKMSFALLEDKDTLLMETLIFSGEGFKRKEKQYILSIGDVDIKKGTGIDSIQVYLDGELQEKAGAWIIDANDYNASICYKRDILLTFNDGTSAKLSELINPGRETMRNLVKSMGEMYLSKQIVDYIAFSIYYNNN